MRALATGLVCVLAAFGAAFLITRAVDHGGSAPAAAAATRLPPLPTGTVAAASDPALAAQFAPQRVSLRRPPAKPKPKPQPAVVASASPAPAAPITTSAATPTPAPVYTAPTYTPAPVTPAPSASSPRHSSSGSGSGSGTTIIGG